jgi:hypothetical protein
MLYVLIFQRGILVAPELSEDFEFDLEINDSIQQTVGYRG